MNKLGRAGQVEVKGGEHLVRKISELLYVPHSAFIAAKDRAGGGR